jgi:hypothetical protein
MKRFPFKTLFLCIILPPVCYILTLQGLEVYIKERETKTLERIIIQNSKALLEGRYTVEEEISRNIARSMRGRFINKMGVRSTIDVRTKEGRILYPPRIQRRYNAPGLGDYFSNPATAAVNFMDIAEENFKILNEGVVASADIRIEHNGWLSNSILILYILIAAFVIQKVVRKSINRTENWEKEQSEQIQDLTQRLSRLQKQNKETADREEHYRKRIAELQKSKEDLAQDVDGLLEEMETLEHGLAEQQQIKAKRELEVCELKAELGEMKTRLQKPKKVRKKEEKFQKRFRVLYKNLTLTDRAIEGFSTLTEDVQIKAEETIHQLNQDPEKVTVRRKVFGKGGKMPILEGEFSYAGRIYFQKALSHGTKVLAIGTKNTQEKDLKYLESVK